MLCTEAYKEHIMYTFHGFCKVVIRNAAITAWRDRQRRHKREISLEYLTEEKFYSLGTADEYFTVPYEECPVTICGQTIILTNGKLAAALLSLPEQRQEIIYLYFFKHYRQWEIGKMYGRCRSTAGYQIHRTLKLLRKEMGGAFTWGIRILSLMKRLCGRPAESRKPWTRFYGITADKSGLPPLKTDTSTRTQRTV